MAGCPGGTTVWSEWTLMAITWSRWTLMDHSQRDAQNAFGHVRLWSPSSHLAMPARHAYHCYIANNVLIRITPCHSGVDVLGLHGKMPKVMECCHKVPFLFGRHIWQALFWKQIIMPLIFNMLDELFWQFALVSGMDALPWNCCHLGIYRRWQGDPAISPHAYPS